MAESIQPKTFGYTLPPAKFVGALSCAAASCHGGAAGGPAGSEYTTWADHVRDGDRRRPADPHSGAYEVLFNSTSRGITKNLNEHLPAHQNPTCLKCHAPDAATDKVQPLGVSCESCHGPAERWLSAHYRSDFKSLSAKEKADLYGLYPTKDLSFRITACASCHVGDATREVNHDPIAAGHPRLAFEYTAYQAHPHYTRHWRETAYGPDFEARAWEIGQAACARSAVELLKSRAEKAAKGGPWPEFSEYRCFACHQDVSNTGRKLVGGSTRRPGALAWGTWYTPMLELLGSEQSSLAISLGRLKARVESPSVSAAEVAADATAVRVRLEDLMTQLQNAGDRDSQDRPYSAEQVRLLFERIGRHALTDDGQAFRDSDWDHLTQHYLGAAALYSAWGRLDRIGRDAGPRRSLEAMGGLLAFPRNYNSPRGTDPAQLLPHFQSLRRNPPTRPGGP